MKPSSLWRTYLILKATIQIKQNINNSNYKKLVAFLKKKILKRGYEPKESKAFSEDDRHKEL